MSIRVDQLHPTVGAKATITVTGVDGLPVDGAVVHVVYLPNSKVERQVEVGTTGADGRLEWAPEAAGVVRLVAGEAGSVTAAVRFDGVPASGLLVLVLAGALLFGGVAFAFRRLMSR